MNLKNIIVEKVETMKDGGLRVRLITRELPPVEQVALMSLVHQEAEEVNLESFSGDLDTKTPSTRLRACLYRLWESQYQGKFKTFALFYEHYMEIIINKIKDQIS